MRCTRTFLKSIFFVLQVNKIYGYQNFRSRCVSVLCQTTMLLCYFDQSIICRTLSLNKYNNAVLDFVSIIIDFFIFICLYKSGICGTHHDETNECSFIRLKLTLTLVHTKTLDTCYLKIRYGAFGREDKIRNRYLIAKIHE